MLYVPRPLPPTVETSVSLSAIKGGGVVPRAHVNDGRTHVGRRGVDVRRNRLEVGVESLAGMGDCRLREGGARDIQTPHVVRAGGVRRAGDRRVPSRHARATIHTE
jgi:hypothetical protein